MFIEKIALRRRTFLRGMGVTLGLPLLDAMVPALTALAKTPANPPRRAGFIYIPNGAVVDKASHGVNAWAPETEGSRLTLSPILKPLEKHQDRLVVVSNLNQSVATPMGDGAGDHARATSTWLSGVRIKKTEGVDVRANTTVDQMIAKEFSQFTPLPSLELALDTQERVGNCDAGYSCSYLYSISWRTPTTPNPMENNPRVVFERLFGEGDSAEDQRRNTRRNQSILDSITDEISRLRMKLGTRDRARMSEYLDSVRDIERRIQMVEARGGQNSLKLPDEPIGIPDSFEEHIKLLYDLWALALQADVTRVVSFQTSYETNTRTYPQIGVPESHHSLSHHGHSTHNVEQLIKINTYHVQMFAYLVDKLRSIPEGDGTLLDNTLIAYGGAMSDGNNHSHSQLPFMLVGGAGGQLKGNRHLVYPDPPELSRAWLNVLDFMGVPADRLRDATGQRDRLSDL